MQIRRFYQPEYEPGQSVITLDEAETQHALRVLRLEPGDALQVLNGRGTIAKCDLLADNTGVRRPKTVSVRVLEESQVSAPTQPLTLCVAIPRGKTIDLVLKAATELGVAEIQPIICQYGVSRPDESVVDAWEAVLTAALKQSMNPWRPHLHPPKEFAHAFDASGHLPGVFGASPAAEATAHQVLSAEFARTVRQIWIGPEGGFAPQEEDVLLANGCCPITIGNCILRVETAVPAMLGFLYSRIQQ